MKFGKTIQLIGLAAILSIVLFASTSLAAEGGVAIGTGEKIVGPTMWAVGVVECTSLQATLRVKNIEGCNVTTDHLFGSGAILTLTACPDDGISDIINVRLPEGSVFGYCADPNNAQGLTYRPIITKVKNYVSDNGIVSFDAQIQFVVPDTYAGSECK